MYNCTLHVSEAYSVREGNENQIWKKGSGVCGIMFYRSMLSCTVHEHYQIEITIHPQQFSFTLAPASPLLSTLLPPTIRFFSFFLLTKKQRSRKGQCFQQCVGLSSWLNHTILTIQQKDCIQSMF